MNISRRLKPCLGLLALTGCTVPITACATLWLDPIHKTGPDTYQITHTMGTYSPVNGVRTGTVARAKRECDDQRKTYTKVREEMGTSGGLSYTLIFTCTGEEIALPSAAPKHKIKL